MKSHLLKTHASAFDAVWRGDKLFEFRKNDREFTSGDELMLEEIFPNGHATGRHIFVKVAYTLYGPDFGVPIGFCVMSLDPDSIEYQGGVNIL